MKTAKKTYKRKKNVEATSKNSQKNVESKAIARDTKYIYPGSDMTKEERKKFREKSRSTFRRFQKEIEKATSASAKKKTTTEFNKFLKETFVEGVKAEIGR